MSFELAFSGDMTQCDSHHDIMLKGQNMAEDGGFSARFEVNSFRWPWQGLDVDRCIAVLILPRLISKGRIWNDSAVLGWSIYFGACARAGNGGKLSWNESVRRAPDEAAARAMTEGPEYCTS
jgi:hypothetical protein